MTYWKDCLVQYKKKLKQHVRTCKNRTLTWSIQLDALVLPLWTLTIVAVPQASVTLQAVYSEDVLGAGGPFPVTVLCQITVILLPPALPGSR